MRRNVLDPTKFKFAGLTFFGPVDFRQLPRQPGILLATDRDQVGHLLVIGVLATTCLQSTGRFNERKLLWEEMTKGRGPQFAFRKVADCQAPSVERALKRIKKQLPEDGWDFHWSNVAAPPDPDSQVFPY